MGRGAEAPADMGERVRTKGTIALVLQCVGRHSGQGDGANTSCGIFPAFNRTLAPGTLFNFWPG